jgi:hypothetical protein
VNGFASSACDGEKIDHESLLELVRLPSLDVLFGDLKDYMNLDTMELRITVIDYFSVMVLKCALTEASKSTHHTPAVGQQTR